MRRSRSDHHQLVNGGPLRGKVDTSAPPREPIFFTPLGVRNAKG